MVRATADFIDVGELGKGDVGPSLNGHHATERGIRHPVHGSQSQNGLWQRRPKAHARTGAEPIGSFAARYAARSSSASRRTIMAAA